MGASGQAIGQAGGAAIGGAFGGPVGASIGGSLGGAFGGMFGGGAPGKRRKNENYGKLRKQYSSKTAKNPRGGLQNQEITGAYGYAGQQVGGGYGQALQQINQMGGAQRQQIYQGQQQQIASTNQGMTNRGLYNTSVGAGAGQQYQNIRQNTQMALGNLQSNLAGLRANLYTQRGNAMGQLGLGKLGAQMQTRGSYAGVLSGNLAAPSAEGGWQAGAAPGLTAEQAQGAQTLGTQIGGLFGGSSPGYTNLPPGTASTGQQGPGIYT